MDNLKDLIIVNNEEETKELGPLLKDKKSN